jgi:hypothetical protein
VFVDGVETYRRVEGERENEGGKDGWVAQEWGVDVEWRRLARL